MKRNDAEGFAQRLYARVPGHYRGFDAERGQPLLASCGSSASKWRMFVRTWMHSGMTSLSKPVTIG